MMDKNTTNLGISPKFDLPGSGIQQPPGPTPGQIKEDAKKTTDPPKQVGLFLVRTGNECLNDAKQRPIPKRLFGDFWFEHELCILFADTNLGKSILAVQIGNGISKGEKTLGMEVGDKQPVLYLDCELSDKQFEARYSVNFQNHYRFSDLFHRAEIDPDADIPEAFKNNLEGYIIHSLEKAIERTRAKIVVVDNLTYLRSATEKAQDALPLMKELKSLKAKHKLSILCLAHTPKRDLTKPITRNDLQGSKMLINFTDSAFAIGESHTDKNVRYLKQIKARNTEIIYDAENVIQCQVVKPGNFLQFEFLGFSNERDHLRVHTPESKEDLINQVVELAKTTMTQREIASKLNISVGAVNKYLKKAKEQSEPQKQEDPPF